MVRLNAAMSSKQPSASRPTSIAMAGIVLLLLVWSFVENFAPLKPEQSAPPGTTFNSAAGVGATVAPSVIDPEPANPEETKKNPKSQ